MYKSFAFRKMADKNGKVSMSGFTFGKVEVFAGNVETVYMKGDPSSSTADRNRGNDGEFSREAGLKLKGKKHVIR